MAEIPTDVEVIVYCSVAYCVRAHDAVRLVRQQVEGRAAQPTAALVDSQSLRGAETVAAQNLPQS